MQSKRNKSINYVIAGKNNIAINVLKYFLKNIEHSTVKVVLNKTDKCIDTWQLSLGKYANENLIEIIELKDCYSIKNLIFISLEFDKIIKPSLFDSTAKLFNIHFSKLPSYKGMYTSVMPIMNGEKESGVTLHRIDHGIDTGDIIAQEVFSISETEIASTLYEKYITHGTSLVIKYLSRLNDVYSNPQGYIGSSYYSKFFLDFTNVIIDLNNTAESIVNQIKSFCFRAYQLPRIFGEVVFGAVVVSEKSIGNPGTILVNNDLFFIICSIDYNILIYKDCFSQLLDFIKNNNINQVSSYINKFLINERSVDNGWSPLIVASYNNSYDIVKLLVEFGADVNLPNYNGTTPLMYAKDAWIRSGSSLVFEFLLENGADPNLKDFNGLNLLDYVQRRDSSFYELIKNIIDKHNVIGIE